MVDKKFGELLFYNFRMTMFKDILKSLRKERNISQSKLAEIIGVTQNTVDNWEHDACMPNASYVLALADYFEVSTDYLFGRTDDYGNIVVNGDLSEQERLLLSAFKNASPEKKESLLDFAKFLISNNYR